MLGNHRTCSLREACIADAVTHISTSTNITHISTSTRIKLTASSVGQSQTVEAFRVEGGALRFGPASCLIDTGP